MGREANAALVGVFAVSLGHGPGRDRGLCRVADSCQCSSLPVGPFGAQTTIRLA